MENRENVEEISLREIIEIIIKRKFTIAIITILIASIVGFYTFFITDPTYEVSSILMASNLTEDFTRAMNDEDQNLNQVLNSLVEFPVMTLESYRVQIGSHEVMNRTIEELGLEDEYSPESLSRRIRVDIVDETNLIEISMEHTDSEKAANIVNSVSRNFTDIVAENLREQFNDAFEYIEDQMEVEKKKLDLARNELKDFLSESPSINELKNELDAMLDILDKYKTDLKKEKFSLQNNKIELRAVEEELQSTPKYLKTRKSILDEDMMRDLVTDANEASSTELIKIGVESEEINPIYRNLKSSQSNLRVSINQSEEKVKLLEEEISKTSELLEDIQIAYQDKRFEQDEINQRLSLAESSYRSFFRKNEELRITESSQIAESTIIVSSEAFPSTTIVGPRKMLNLAIGIVLGLMLGVFLGFFIEYWESTGKKKE